MSREGGLALFVGGPLDMVTGRVDLEGATIECAGGRYVRLGVDPRFDWMEIEDESQLAAT